MIIVSSFLNNLGIGYEQIIRAEDTGVWGNLENRINSYLKELKIDGEFFIDNSCFMFVRIDDVLYELYDLKFPKKDHIMNHGKSYIKEELQKIIEDARERQQQNNAC